jgi:predicted small secreted protein
MVKKALLIIMLFFVILSAVGCQTVQGVGGDIRWLGGARDNK